MKPERNDGALPDSGFDTGLPRFGKGSAGVSLQHLAPQNRMDKRVLDRQGSFPLRPA
jgi:hypothetical protein